jgi:hypothetical protein
VCATVHARRPRDSPQARALHNAGVIGDTLVATGIARFDMTTEDGGAAGLDRRHDTALGGRHRHTRLCAIRIAVAAEHVRHFERRRVHGARALEVRGRWRFRCDRTWEPIERTRRCTHFDRCDPQIARRRGQTAMAEQQLNRPDVRTGFKEMYSKCMTGHAD